MTALTCCWPDPARPPLAQQFLAVALLRITDEHRMVYKVEKDTLLIAQLRYHY
ncbi:MAG: type II toxin-antitoxin system YoeB family toxin [Rubrivivax sp.]